MTKWPIILAAACLPIFAGCTSKTVHPVVPAPTNLTEPCPIPHETWETTDDIVRESQLRGEALKQCNAKLDSLRDLSKAERESSNGE